MAVKFSKFITTGCIGLSTAIYLKCRSIPTEIHALSEAGDSQRAVLPNGLILRNVQIFIRHGARSPLKKIPYLEQAHWPKDAMRSDPPGLGAFHHRVIDFQGQPLGLGKVELDHRKTVLHGGTFTGQLTERGKRQLYDLGLRLRKDYMEQQHLLDPEFNNEEIYVRSTNITRTIESATWLVSGLFKLKSSDVESANRGRPITIYAADESEEILYPNYALCDSLSRLGKRIMQLTSKLDGFTKDRDDLEAFLNYDRELHKKRIDFVELRDEVWARLEHNLELHPGLLSWKDKIDKHAVAVLSRMVTGHEAPVKVRREILRLACGPVLHMAEENMKSAFANKSRHKLMVFSCHDSLMIALVIALGIYDGTWPPYAADLRLELIEDRRTGKPLVRVRYLGDVKKIPGLKEAISGEIGIYSLKDFASFLKDVSVDRRDLLELCQRRSPHMEPIEGIETEASCMDTRRPDEEKKK